MKSTDPATTPRPIRAAVFRSVNDAHEAVDRLLEAGIQDEQISVLCSEEAKERHFQEFEHEMPAGSHTAEAAVKGGAAGAIVGGLVSTGLATAAGLSLLAAGPSFLIGGAVAGSFIAAMQTRGEEGTLADYYDQALTRGDILVAVEDHSERARERLAQAESVFRRCGADPIPLESED